MDAVTQYALLKDENERLTTELAEANAARERAEAKCEEMKSHVARYERKLAQYDSGAEALLDRLHRAEALRDDMAQWAQDNWVAFNDQARAVMSFADKLEQALKEEPHAK